MEKQVLITEEIKDCIISHLSDKLNQQQSEKLLLWINASAEHKLYFRQLTEIWHSSAVLGKGTGFNVQEAWREIFEKIQINDANAQPNKKKSTLKTLPMHVLLRSAAIWILIFGLGGFMTYFILTTGAGKEVAGENVVTIHSPLGSRTNVTLSDGTTVWLNAGSILKYSNYYGIKIREVNLDGEAYFKVAKNKNCPFVVKTSSISITALGTAFNVKAYQNENTIETTLEEGSVKIESLHTDQPATAFSPIVLEPNQKVVFSKIKKTTSVEHKQEENQDEIKNAPSQSILKTIALDQVKDIKIHTSWKDRRWIIRNEPLESLIIKLERKYNVKFVFESTKLKEYVFTGTLEDETLEQVLNVIRLTAPLDYKIIHNIVQLNENIKLKDKYKNLLNTNN